MTCESEARIDTSGELSGEVRLYFLRVPTVTMRLSIRVEPASR